MSKTVLYASVGPELTLFDIDMANAALTKRDTVTLPANIQYAWSHPSTRYFYIVSSNGGPGRFPTAARTTLRFLRSTRLHLLYASLTLPLAYCYISSFRRVSHAARPEHGGENMTAVWASRHKERCSAGVVAPHAFDPLSGPARGVVLDRCTPPGAAVDAVLEAATHARRAEHPGDSGVVSVPQVLHVSLRVPRINAQRGARFDHYCTRNCLSPKELRRNLQ